MANAETRIRHWDFVIDSDFWFRNSDFTSVYPLVPQPPLRIQRRLAPHPRRGDRLLIRWIGHVPGCKNSLHARRGAKWIGEDDVPARIGLHLIVQKLRIR